MENQQKDMSFLREKPDRLTQLLRHLLYKLGIAETILRDSRQSLQHPEEMAHSTLLKEVLEAYGDIIVDQDHIYYLHFYDEDGSMCEVLGPAELSDYRKKQL